MFVHVSQIPKMTNAVYNKVSEYEQNAYKACAARGQNDLFSLERSKICQIYWITKDFVLFCLFSGGCFRTGTSHMVLNLLTVAR